MEWILLALVCFSAGTISCLQFHYVAKPRTWTEAQTYCRETYTDLVTLENADHVTQFTDTVPSAGGPSEVWIGLYVEFDWRWSDGFSGSGADFRNWGPGKPDSDKTQSDSCGVILKDGTWDDVSCHERLAFNCYEESWLIRITAHPMYLMSWYEAQKFCREKHTDLATVLTLIECFTIAFLAKGPQTWIGLFKGPDFFWSDKSSFSFTHWSGGSYQVNSIKVPCAAALMQDSGKWKLLSCDTKLPFVCYGPIKVKKQLLKLRMTLPGSSVDLNHPVVRAQLLQKLQERLKEKNVTGVSLAWRGGPDGKVFHEEDKGSEKTQREKDEF